MERAQVYVSTFQDECLRQCLETIVVIRSEGMFLLEGRVKKS